MNTVIHVNINEHKCENKHQVAKRNLKLYPKTLYCHIGNNIQWKVAWLCRRHNSEWKGLVNKLREKGVGGGDPSQGRCVFRLFRLALGASGASGKGNLPHVFPFSAASRSNSAVVTLCLELPSYHTFEAAQPSCLSASTVSQAPKLTVICTYA